MAVRTQRRSATVEVGGPAAPGETRVRRAFCSPNRLVEGPNEEIKTMADVIPYTAKILGNKRAVGWRKVLKMHTEKKDVTKSVGGKEVTGMSAPLPPRHPRPSHSLLLLRRDQDMAVLRAIRVRISFVQSAL